MQAEFLIDEEGQPLKGQNLERAIREIFLTVGQEGEPGEHIRCIISVAMLTEGWDARTVTDIFGFRAFKSQLLCEQVTGRALRRTSFVEASPETGLLLPEYARVFGVPFSFMNAGDAPPPTPQKNYLVRSVETQTIYRIEFPNIVNYLIEMPSRYVELAPSSVESFTPEINQIPKNTLIEGAVGENKIIYIAPDRNQSILWKLAKIASDRFREIDDPTNGKRLLFASMVQAVQDWLAHPAVKVKSLSALEHAPNTENAALAIAKSCKGIDTGRTITPVFENEIDRTKPRFLHTGNTEFWTGLKHRYPKHKKATLKKSELNIAACHSDPETQVAEVLDTHPAIHAWARNFRLGWSIPWLDTKTGDWHNYEPDFVVSASGTKTPLRLVIEFKGLTDRQAIEKGKFTEEWWCEALNGQRQPNDPEWRYVFIENRNQIRKAIDEALNH